MNEWGLLAGSMLAGFIASFHCVGMCAPLSCALTKSDSRSQNGMTLIQYHFGRMISYGLIGGIAGSVGSVFFDGIPLQPLKVVSWFFVVVYFILAWGWEVKTTPGSWGFQITRWFYPLLMKFKGRSGFSLGLITPLLPCTPLYLSTSAAFLSGNSVWGTGIMVGFVIGTLPVYGASQLFWIRMQSVFPPRRMVHLRRGLAIIAVGIMAWRLSSGEFMKPGKPCHTGGFPCFGSSGDMVKR
jgi:sulfite exporter TauE/SafE